ncbi:MAG: hypothetical protein WDO69_28175 [Pseudomonadota bacterium]
MNVRRLFFAPIALLTATACSPDANAPNRANAVCGTGANAGGGSASGGVAGVANAGAGNAGNAGASCGDPTLAVDPTALIDDMESPAPSTALSATRGGEWWSGGDDASKAAGAKITPDGDVAAELIPGGRCSSKYAVHVTGQGFQEWSEVSASFGWGSVDGGPPQLLPYDAHTRMGLTFWARIGDTSSASIRLNVSDVYSNDAGGICDKTATSGDTQCYDHFGISLAGLDVTWKQYRIPFSGLSQQMFGLPRPSVDTTRLYSIDFLLPVGSVFDFWVDDISFY